MAKLSAHGAHPIAEARAVSDDDYGRWETVYVLRSDGAVLRRYRPLDRRYVTSSGSYSVAAPPAASRRNLNRADLLAWFTAYAESRGATVGAETAPTARAETAYCSGGGSHVTDTHATTNGPIVTVWGKCPVCGRTLRARGGAIPRHKANRY